MNRVSKIFFVTAIFFLFASFQRKSLTWIAIGDSITYLNDHPDETGNRITKGYMKLVAERLPRIHFINQGHNGWTAGRIADQVDKLGLEKADIYSVFLGTNDWWQGRPVGRLADYQSNSGNGSLYGSFRIIIDKLRLLNPKAKIILIAPMQRTDFVYINDHKNNAYGCYREKNGQRLELFANAVDSIGDLESFPVVDLYHLKGLDIAHLVKFKRLRIPGTAEYKNYVYPSYIDIPFDTGNDEYPYPIDAIDMTYDGLHPSDKGNEMISRSLIRIMKKF